MSCLELAENTYFVFLALKTSRLLKFLQCVRKMRYGGVDDGKGMFNDSEGARVCKTWVGERCLHGAGGVDGSGGSGGVYDSGGSGLFRSSGAGLFQSEWHFRVGWGFCDSGGGNGTGGGVCCEAGSVVFKWEGGLLRTF